MSKIQRLFQSKDKGATGRAGLLQVPLTETQKDTLAPAIADIAEATANTKSGIMLQFLRDGAIGAGEYEAACIEGVYYDTQHREGSDPYPRKYGIVRGYEAYIENLLSHMNPMKTAFACEKADYLLRPVIQCFTALAKREGLKLHEPISDSDPRVNLEAHYAKAVFEAIEDKGGFVSPNAKAAATREGTPPASELIDVVLDNWAICREMSDYLLKYVIYSIAATQNWDEYPTDRLQFMEACREAYQNRKRIEKADREREALFEKPTTLMRYDLAGGDYAAVSDRYHAINPNDAKTCSNVTVIEVKNPDSAFTPSFIFFSAKKAEEMSEEEKTEIISQADQIWLNGSLAEVRDSEIPLETDANGRPTNLEEYLSQPRVLFHAVENGKLYEPGNSPADGMIVRSK